MVRGRSEKEKGEARSSQGAGRQRLSGEDLTFWWTDSPAQPTTMAMLMLLDRAPDEARLRNAFARAVATVPRLAQRVVEAPLGITLPRWERDPTFDIDYHVRRHRLVGRADLEELFREVVPAYEQAFDRSRPLWEARIYEGLGGEGKAALFFKLHHAFADGVGGNAIFAALTDWEREASLGEDVPLPPREPWPEMPSLPARFIDALRDRVALDVERAGAVAGALGDTVREPERLRRAVAALRSLPEVLSFQSQVPLKQGGRARRLSGFDLPFDQMRELKAAIGGSMIDVILTIMARAMGAWYASRGVNGVRELLTLVPVNLRTPEQWADNPNVGNVATGILLPLPIRSRGARAAFREVRKRVEAKKADPLSSATPLLAEVLSVFGSRLVAWMAETTFGGIDFIVTNVPGIRVPRYLAGAEIVAAYPFAPVALNSPVSVALYGYRDRMFIGLDSDEDLMPDVEAFQGFVRTAFEELRAAAGFARSPARKAMRRANRRRPNPKAKTSPRRR